MSDINEEALDLLIKEPEDEPETEEEITFDQFAEHDLKIMNELCNPGEKIDYIDIFLSFMYSIMIKNIHKIDFNTCKNALCEIREIEAQMCEVTKDIESTNIKIVPKLIAILKTHLKKYKSGEDK